jgi:NitT/TauT family transport system substrate-binding protein
MGVSSAELQQSAINCYTMQMLLHVICDEIQDGVPGHGSNELRNDGPIKTVVDLKGNVLATNAMGSAVDIAGLEANRDYTVVEARFPPCARCWPKRKPI